MNKKITSEVNDETVDLGRRGMMTRLGLVASVACAAPVLMTMSTSALANHKTKQDRDSYQSDNGKGGDKSGNENAMEETTTDDSGGGCQELVC